MQRAQNTRSGRSPIRRATPPPPSARRASPRRRQATLSYGIERIDEPFENPRRAQRTPSALRRVIQDSQDEDTLMVDDGSQRRAASQATQSVAEPAGDPESPSHGRDRPSYAIPTTVVLRRDSP